MGQCARVVQAVNSCRENGGDLDLSECQLMQIPDACFHLMRNTPLHSCNLAGNVISKIPPKLAINFTIMTELNISNNRVSSLPSEMAQCTQLESIDISANSFVQIPPVLAEIQTLAKVNASKNFIADVEVEAVVACPSLEQLNLQENPLKKDIFDELSKVTTLRIILSPREQEDWEDLSI